MTEQEEYLIWWLPYWSGYFHEIHLAKWEKRKEAERDDCRYETIPHQTQELSSSH